MANTKSKEKNIKRIKKATERNKAIKSRVRKAIKDAKKGINDNDKKLKELISNAHKEINTAISKGVFHKNNGARKNSKLDILANLKKEK